MFHVSKRSEFGSLAEFVALSGSSGCAKWTAPAIIRPNNNKRTTFTHISGHDVLPLEDHDRREQQSRGIRAADTGVMPKALPRNLGLEHVAPEVHVGSEEIRAQMLEELDSPDDVER